MDTARRARSAALRLVAIRRLEENLWLLSSIIDRLDRAALVLLAASIGAARAPFPEAPRDWRFVARHEHQVFASSIRTALPGFWASIRRQSGAEIADWREPLLVLALAPQATANRHAAMWRVAEGLLHGGVGDWRRREDAVRSALAPLMDPFADGAGRFLGHNMVGKTLAAIAMARLDFGLHSADLDTLRLAVDLKWWAREQGVPAAQVGEWLDLQPPGLRDPIRGLGLAWHAPAREFRFAPPAGAHRQRPSLGVSYAPVERFDARACDKAYRITLAFDAGVAAENAFRLESCGMGRIDLPPVVLHDAEALGVRWLRLDADRSVLRLRVGMSDEGGHGVYDTDVVPWDGGGGPGLRVSALPVGGASIGKLEVVFEPVELDDHLALDLVDRPVRESLAAIAKAAAVRIDGDPGKSRIARRQDGLPVESALALIAEAAGQSLRQTGDRSYRFETSLARGGSAAQ